MGEVIEIVKFEEKILKGDGSDVILDSMAMQTENGEAMELIGEIETIETFNGILPQNSQIIRIVTDYECVTCHRIFQTENLLKEHLEVCREEDDGVDILEIGNFDRYDSEDEDDDEDEDDPNCDENATKDSTSKNNNTKADIKPVSDTQCHCCAEDLATAHSGGPYSCPSCDLSFRKISSLNRHTIVIHWESETCVCKECGATFRDKKSLDKHRYTTHFKNKVFRCEQCDRYFSRSYHLNRHKNQSGCHGVVRNSFSCQVCNKVFTRKDNLREHLRSHAGEPQRQKKPCKYCDKKFYTTQQLVIHERVHTGERPAECDLCSKTFLSPMALKKHRRVHTGEKPFECKFCHKKFGARETLNRHERTHTGDKPHVCKFCNKSFIQAAQLRAHIFHHTGENGFNCDVCGKVFNRKARLNVHKKFVHEGAVPFQCNKCDKTFTRKEDLMKHTNLHSGVKPHKCTKCDKAFAAKSSLQAHMNTHRREPPQSCTECGRAFIRQDCLMRHIRAKHRELLEEPPVGEAEKQQLKEQFLNIATTAAEKIKSGKSNMLTTDELLKSIVQLLTVLIEEETLQMFGWMESPVQDVLEAVIRRCGHEPLSAESDLPFANRLRENIKLLFTAVIEDNTVKSLLTTQTVDDVILHVLQVTKQADEVEKS